MRIVRFKKGRSYKYGILDSNNIVLGLRGSPFPRSKTGVHTFDYDGFSYQLDDIKLAAPCEPSKIVCLGLNYRSHAEEFNLAMPEEPLIFLKPSSAVIGPEQTILLPRFSKRVDYEGELAIVIGRKAKDISEDEVKHYIFGYTCFNDVSERHNQKSDGQWTRAKSYDTFAPIGPWIETDANANKLKLETLVNGEVRQSACTDDLIFGVEKLLNFISQVMTLLPGDVIATGTASGVGRISNGDVVEIKIEQIGTLRNYVAIQK